MPKQKPADTTPAEVEVVDPSFAQVGRRTNTREPKVDDSGEVVVPETKVEKNAKVVMQLARIIRFRERAMIEVQDGFPHFVPLTKERYERIAYVGLGGKTRGEISDSYEFVKNVAEDHSDFEKLILFGRYDIPDGEESLPNHPDSVGPTVWDMDGIDQMPYPPNNCVWRCPYAKIALGSAADGTPNRIPFIMSLAGGDTDLYDDIMQSIAPIVMDRKPDGVIWWIGEGANGKSTLMDALYRMFPGQFSSLTVKRLVDQRDLPALNGTLANIVKESSEGRIDDTEIYKSLGTHESFPAHKFHSQEPITINGNLHHIFSANSVPVFNDKGFSARRRTFIIPFKERFESDPTFEERTFTSEFFGQLAAEMCKYAVRLKRQGYKYKWSAQTQAAKLEYDTEANSANQYGAEILKQGVVAFDGFDSVNNDYNRWCDENGFVALGKGNLRRAIQGLGFERLSIRSEAGIGKQWRLPAFKAAEQRPMGGFRLGIYSYVGFEPEEEPDEIEVPPTPEFHEPAKPEPQPTADDKGSPWS